MKKIFALLAAAAMLCCFSCTKENNNKKDDDNKGGNTDYEAPITIDGIFEDWAKLDPSKVTTAVCADGSSYEALKLVKVYADPSYIYIYFEWDKELVEFTTEGDGENVPFHIYLNADGDTSTGGFSDQFTDACTEFLLEGCLTDGSAIVNYSPDGFVWVGEVNGAGWEWEDAPVSPEFCTGFGIEGKYEIAIERDSYPLGDISDIFSIGFDIQQNWESVGVLPNSDDGNAATLQVITAG